MPHEPRERQLILIVDDDRQIVQALGIRLQLAGYEVLTAHDGVEGLAAAVEAHPDAILLDIRMPRMDGLTMLSRLRQHKEIGTVPTIVLSANIAERVRAEAWHLNACFFLDKPYEPKTLLMALQSALEGGPVYANA
jgi:DNA-binding response OmpR family regulator